MIVLKNLESSQEIHMNIHPKENIYDSVII